MLVIGLIRVLRWLDLKVSRTDFYWSYKMAVQQNKKSRARRNQRRSHDALTGPTLSVDKTTGEVHRRHHMTADGFYKGKKVLNLGDE